MNTQLRISAKLLGELALPNSCPRCFWLKLKLGNKLPFQIFPGIFSSIDSYTKNMVHYWFDTKRFSPIWLQEIGELTGYINPPHYTKFNIVDRQNHIFLTGVPDGIFVKSDGSYVIIDYKTARYTDTQDRLLPLYQAQLNAYALIGEQCGITPVSDLALIYMEPATDQEAVCTSEYHKDDGFLMAFKAKMVKVPKDVSTIMPLLKRARDIYELSEPPAISSNCKDCASVGNLVELVRQV